MNLSFTKQWVMLCTVVLLATTVSAQNTMLSSPATGVPIFPLGAVFDGIEMASNGTDVVLMTSASNSNKIYAIDIADNNPADAASNTITQIPNINSLLAGATGYPAGNVEVVDIEVNPISKSVYVLTKNTSTNQSKVVIIEDDGATVSVMNTSTLTYSAMNWGGNGMVFNDMCYGDDTLYATSGSWSLDGEIARFAAPFAHNSNAQLRSTTMYKTNWGNNYFTSAPLEKLDYAVINNEERLMGVTVCAPGFSLETKDIPGSGLLYVTEDFNIRYSPPKKVVHQFQNGTHYLFNLHTTFSPVLMRIGEHYIDGSQVDINNHNNNADHLRTTSGTRTAGLTDNDLIIYNNSIEMMAFFDNYNLVVLENDSLKMFQTGMNVTNTTQVENDLIEVECFPNPASKQVQIKVGDNDFTDLTLSIYSLDGKELLQNKLTDVTTTVDIQRLNAGQYFVVIKSDDKTLHSDKLVIKK